MNCLVILWMNIFGSSKKMHLTYTDSGVDLSRFFKVLARTFLVIFAIWVLKIQLIILDTTLTFFK